MWTLWGFTKSLCIWSLVVLGIIVMAVPMWYVVTDILPILIHRLAH